MHIDVSRVPQLTVSAYEETTGRLTVGASISINSLIDLLAKYCGEAPPSYPYGSSVLQMIHDHLKLVAHEQVGSSTRYCRPPWFCSSGFDVTLFISIR